MATRSKIEKAAKSAPAKKSGFVSRRDWLWGLILVVAVILAYQPVWYAGFNWDDNDHVTANPCIVGPLGLKEIWTTKAARICPLVLTTFWVEHRLWGLAPLPFHLVTLLMHVGSAVVLWLVLRRLLVPGAWWGAALWALHPVQVETVAWVTELKNTQSCFFYLLSIYFWAGWLNTRGGGDQTRTAWNYGLTLLFAAMAMASKSSTVILPLVLCLCAWWVEGRWNWRNLWRITPVFFMSAAFAALSMWTQKMEGASDQQTARSWPERFATAGDVIWFYLGKLLWPHPLIFIYPRWQIHANQPLAYLPLLAAIIVFVLLWLYRESWARPGLFAFAYFVVALLPVLGLANHFFLHYSFVGDHFQYLASIGPLALAGALLYRWAHLVFVKHPRPASVLGAVLLFVLGAVSWQRVWVYQNEEKLWLDTMTQNPACWLAYNNYGKIIVEKGQLDEGMALFRKALELYPDYDLAHLNMGNAFMDKGQLDEALVEYQRAVKLNPIYDKAHFDLGVALDQKNEIVDAMAEYQKAIDLNPYNAGAHNNLGTDMAKKGQLNEALAQFQEAVRLQPDFGQAQANVAQAEAIISQMAARR